MIKNNQAVVPINAFFGSFMAKKYKLAKDPARFPIMVVNPAVSPIKPANLRLSGTDFELLFSHQYIIRTETSITPAILFLKNASGT